MSRKDNELYEFGEFRLDVAEHRLTRTDDVPVAPIPEKAFQTLVHLIRNSGSLVTKKDLLETVWPDAIVEENNLDKAIHTLRLVLGEKNGDQKYIETVRKHGYRFLPPVRTVSAPSNLINSFRNGSLQPKAIPILAKPQITASGQHVMFDIAIDEIGSLDPDTVQIALAGGPDARPEANQRTWRRGQILLSAVVMIIGIAAVAAYLYSRGSAAPSSKSSLLVFPIASIGPSRDELLELGLADSLIHQLSAKTGLNVRPLSATLMYSATSADPVTAGREQRVDYVLASGYQVADGRVRITSRLINVVSGEVEDFYRVDTAAGDVFSIQDAFTEDVGYKILNRLGGTISPARRRGTSNEEAYRHYLHGMSMLDQRKGTQAEESLGKAVALDPNYGLAWAGKALAHRTVGGSRDVNTRVYYDLTIEAANRALALDPSLADAYSAICLARIQYEYDATGAEQACKKALELDPRSSIAYLSYAWVLNYTGRHSEAIAGMKVAIDLEPVSYQNQRMYANTLYLARKHEEAHPQYVRLNQLNPSVLPTYEWSICNSEALGKYDEALEWLVRSLRVRKIDEATIEKFTKAFASSGWEGVLRERERMDADETNYFRRAGVNAALGNLDTAFELLNKVFERRAPLLPLIRIDPRFDPLRNDPRYHDLLRRINLK